MATQQRQIVAGPSKADLQKALFDEKHVEFTLDDRTKIEVVIRTVQCEGGLESWIISGYIVRRSSEAFTPWQPFSGYYQTVRRTGCVKVETVAAKLNEGLHMGPAHN